MSTNDSVNNSSSLQAIGSNLSDNGNYNNNYNTSSLDNNVSSSITLAVTTPTSTPSQIGNLNLDNLSVQNQGGSFLLMPDMGNQTLDGNGNVFHLDQVNSLISNGDVSHLSVGLDVGSMSGTTATDLLSPDGADGSHGAGSFSQTAQVTGAGAAAPFTQEAFTQHVSLGSNLQYNNLPMTVVGGDSYTGLTGDVHHVT